MVILVPTRNTKFVFLEFINTKTTTFVLARLVGTLARTKTKTQTEAKVPYISQYAKYQNFL